MEQFLLNSLRIRLHGSFRLSLVDKYLVVVYYARGSPKILSLLSRALNALSRAHYFAVAFSCALQELPVGFSFLTRLTCSISSVF